MVLNAQQLKQRLERGEIFRPGTWDAACIRGTSYDLRIADDVMVIPDRLPDLSRAAIRRYDKDHPRRENIILSPGDVAFVSTRERICIPWDLTGYLGAKFSLTAYGVMVMTGLFVEPGAGLIYNAEHGWEAKDDERLHFLLANVGPESITLTPNVDKIAAVRFEVVLEPTQKMEVQGAEYDRMVQHIFDHAIRNDSGAGLVFFHHMANVLSDMAAVKKSADSLTQGVEANVKRLEQKIDVQNSRISGIESGSNQILVFGVFLVCVTILGVAIAVMFTIIANLKVTLTWDVSIVLAAAILGVSAMVVSFLRSFALKEIISKSSYQSLARSASEAESPPRDQGFGGRSKHNGEQ